MSAEGETVNIIVHEEKQGWLLSELREYWMRSWRWLLVVFITLFLVYGSQVWNSAIRIDSTTMLLEQGSTFNWLEIGRSGLVLTKLLFGMMKFNPYCAGVAWMLAMVVTCFAFGFLFYKVSDRRSNLGMVVFGMLLFVHPMWAEQFYFTLQNFEIMMALLYSIVAAFFIFLWCEEKKLRFCILGILFMIWSFSSYQIFPIYYVAIVSACFLLLYTRALASNESFPFWQLSIRFAWTCIVSFLISSAVGTVFFSGSEYMDILVDRGGLLLTIRNFIAHIAKALIGYQDFYTAGYTLSCLLFVGVLSFLWKKYRPKQHLLFFLVAAAVFELTPYLMSLYLGHSPSYRVQIILPFVIAFHFFFGYQLLLPALNHPRKNKVAIAMAIIFAISFWGQAMQTERLLYTDEVRYQQDVQRAGQVALKIGEYTGTMEPQMPIAFIGEIYSPLTPAAIRGDMVGRNLAFGPYEDAALANWALSCTLQLFNSLGYSYHGPTSAQFTEAISHSADMPRISGSSEEIMIMATP